MKRFAIIVIFLLSLTAVNAQDQFFPSAVILSPHTTSADERYSVEIELSERHAARNLKERLALERQFQRAMKNEPENERIMGKKDRTFMRSINFYTHITYTLEQYLQYRFMEKFPKLLLFASKETSAGDSLAYIKIADKNEVQFVINPVEVNSYVENNKKYTKIRFQVFDRSTNRIVLDKIYTGNDKNPGGDFTCNEGSIDCTVNNALIRAINDLTKSMLRKPQAQKTPSAEKK